MNALGPSLRSMRLSRGWSQEQMGLELGVSKATISKWESGRSQPDWPTLIRLRSLFGSRFSLDQLATPDGGIAEGPAAYHADPDDGHLSEDERRWLAAFRRLTRPQRAALLALVGR